MRKVTRSDYFWFLRWPCQLATPITWSRQSLVLKGSVQSTAYLPMRLCDNKMCLALMWLYWLTGRKTASYSLTAYASTSRRLMVLWHNLTGMTWLCVSAVLSTWRSCFVTYLHRHDVTFTVIQRCYQRDGVVSWHNFTDMTWRDCVSAVLSTWRSCFVTQLHRHNMTFTVFQRCYKRDGVVSWHSFTGMTSRDCVSTVLSTWRSCFVTQLHRDIWHDVYCVLTVLSTDGDRSCIVTQLHLHDLTVCFSFPIKVTEISAIDVTEASAFVASTWRSCFVTQLDLIVCFSGAINVTGTLDFETASSHTFTVMASDGNMVSQHLTAWVSWSFVWLFLVAFSERKLETADVSTQTQKTTKPKSFILHYNDCSLGSVKTCIRTSPF